MQQKDTFPNLANNLRSALGALELDANSSLYRDTVLICNYLENPIFRVAVFAPFNYGKSTLLNALLGQRTLPIGLIPTTGAAISVGYGQELHTRITLTNGEQISESGTKILQEYAVLDGQRCMRPDVASVQVYCPNSFLQTGVEFLDLPGTNDQEAQDILVRDQLLTADLVVQVLDGRQLMTLGERENLRDWLIERRINTVVFVVNFLNLLEPEDQKEVYHRLRFVAESFRAELPPNISNLYRVDALPALRARLKGEASAAQTTGLASFESALQSIVGAAKETQTIRIPRLVAIATQVKEALQAKAQTLTSELATVQQKQQAKTELQQKAIKLIKQGLQASISEFESWLYLPNLLTHYQSVIALALQKGKFTSQETGQFQQEVQEFQKKVSEWVEKGCEFLERDYPGDLVISFLDAPQVKPDKEATANPELEINLSTGLNWLTQGHLGAAALVGASYILNKTTGGKKKQKSNNPNSEQLAQACNDAAQEYLTRFSTEATTTLRQYQAQAEQLITYRGSLEKAGGTIQTYQLHLLNSLLDSINWEIEDIRTNRASESSKL
ncbi:MAG: dynamin family protein [Coleofasciculaceae cyanobacterium]